MKDTIMAVEESVAEVPYERMKDTDEEDANISKEDDTATKEKTHSAVDQDEHESKSYTFVLQLSIYVALASHIASLVLAASSALTDCDADEIFIAIFWAIGGILGAWLKSPKILLVMGSIELYQCTFLENECNDVPVGIVAALCFCCNSACCFLLWQNGLVTKWFQKIDDIDQAFNEDILRDLERARGKDERQEVEVERLSCFDLGTRWLLRACAFGHGLLILLTFDDIADDEIDGFGIMGLAFMGIFASCTSRRKLLLVVGSLHGALVFFFLGIYRVDLALSVFTLMSMSFISASMLGRSMLWFVRNWCVFLRGLTLDSSNLSSLKLSSFCMVLLSQRNK